MASMIEANFVPNFVPNENEDEELNEDEKLNEDETLNEDGGLSMGGDVKKVIFLVSGKARHGKDTVGGILEERYGFGVSGYHFADSLKALASKSFNWDGNKDQRGRKLLIDIGASARAYDPDYWAKLTCEKIEKTGALRVSICDWRFPNEEDYVKKWATEKGFEVITLRVIRYNEDNTIFQNDLGINANDVSETALDGKNNFDYVLKNKRIPELNVQIGEMMSELRIVPVEGRPHRISGQIMSADEFLKEATEGNIKHFIKPGGISFDFDDTLLEKTGLYPRRLDFFRFVCDSAKNQGIPIYIVTARRGETEEIVDFCEKYGIEPDKIIYGSRYKADVLKKLLVLCHYDDDVETNRCLAQEGITSFLMGAFTDPEYIRVLGEIIYGDAKELAAYKFFYTSVEEALRRKTIVTQTEIAPKNIDEINNKYSMNTINTMNTIKNIAIPQNVIENKNPDDSVGKPEKIDQNPWGQNDTNPSGHIITCL